MKTARFVLSVTLSLIVIVFAVLGLLGIVSYDIGHPIMFVALATLLVVRSIDAKMNKDNLNFVLMLVSALFVYAVVVYNLFIG